MWSWKEINKVNFRLIARSFPSCFTILLFECDQKDWSHVLIETWSSINLPITTFLRVYNFDNVRHATSLTQKKTKNKSSNTSLSNATEFLTSNWTWWNITNGSVSINHWIFSGQIIFQRTHLFEWPHKIQQNNRLLNGLSSKIGHIFI